EVAHAGQDAGFTGREGAAFGAGDDVFHAGDACADAHAGGLIDVRASPGQADGLFDQSFDVLRRLYDRGGFVPGVIVLAVGPGVLLADLNGFAGGLGIMRANHRTDSVLQRGDDSAAVGVVLGVRAERQAAVEIQSDRIPANLHVTFFKDIEQADLNT